jgi:hypothetical protein
MPTDAEALWMLSLTALIATFGPSLLRLATGV